MTSEKDFQTFKIDSATLSFKDGNASQTDLLKYFQSTEVNLSQLQQETHNLQSQIFFGKILLAVLLLIVAGGMTWFSFRMNQSQSQPQLSEESNNPTALEEIDQLKERVNNVEVGLSTAVQNQLQSQQTDIEEINIRLNSLVRNMDSGKEPPISNSNAIDNEDLKLQEQDSQDIEDPLTSSPDLEQDSEDESSTP